MSVTRLMSLAALSGAALLLAGCNSDTGAVLQGWVEADFVFVSADEAGRVEDLTVREGDKVNKGTPLFTVDDDLQKADVTVRKATVTNAQQAFDRARELLKTAAGTQKNYDDAEAALRQAQANLAWSETRLARRRVFSPASGSIHQIYYRPGETVQPGRPVIALLPPENLKIRFFASETALPNISLGDSVAVSCDGCGKNLTARVSFISRNAEYTPPVIYSLEERNKLVFMVEARPLEPDKFRVGQPVSVALREGAAGKEARR